MLLQGTQRLYHSGTGRNSCQIPASNSKEQQGVYRAANNVPASSLGLYFSSVRRYGLLTREEEQYYARRLRNGEAQARKMLLLCNQRLVISQARRYRGGSLGLLELVAEGNLGLIQAVDRFDPAYQVKFSTYAVPWVRQAMQRALLKQRSFLRTPHRVDCQIRKLKRLQSRHASPRPDLYSLARQLGLGKELLQRIRAGLEQSRVSLDDAGLGPEDNARLCAKKSDSCPYLATWQDNQRALVERLLAELGPSERLIVSMRFGLLDGKEYNLEEIARAVGRSREKVRRWLLDILQRLHSRLDERGIGAKLLFQTDLH